MADNTLLNSGSGGDTLRTLEDGSSIKWPTSVMAYATTVGTPDVLTIPVAAALADDMSNPTTLLTGSCFMVWDGATWDRAPGTSADGLQVNLGTNNDVTIDGSSIVHLEDVQHTTGDAGVMSLAVRNDTLAALATTDGDYAPLQVDANGALYTAGIDVYAVDTPAGGTDNGNPALAIQTKDPATLTSADGDYVNLRTSDSGSLWVREEQNKNSQDIFQRNISVSPNNDIDVQFFRAAPELLVNVTTANSATATQNVGGALFASSTNANGSVQGVTQQKTVYRSGSEIYCMFTASFTAGIASSYMRIGLFDANEGFYIGYEGTTFRVAQRNNASDTPTDKGSWSEDQLTGAAGSRFTRAGVEEAIDLTKLNVFRIRFGWLGSAPVYFEVLSPDGEWVCFHKILYPNLQAAPSIRSADLPVTLDITKTAAAATDLQIQTDCWGAGATLVEQTGLVDQINSRFASTLNGGTSWNASGGWTDVHRYSLTTILLYSTSAESGTLQVEFSMDASTVHRTINYTVADSSNHPPHTLIPISQYMRVSFDADGTSPTNDHANLTIQTLHHVNKSKGLTSRVDQAISDDSDVENVRAVLVGKGTGGSYVNVGVTPQNSAFINLEEIKDVAIDSDSGTVGPGTLRVVLPTDQPALDVSAATVTVTGTVTANAGTGTLSVDLGGNNDVTVDGSAVVATFGTDTYTETSTTGIPIGAVRNDTLATLVDTDNEIAPLQVNASGALYVQEGAALDVSGATVTVDLAGNNDVQGAVAHDSPVSTPNPFLQAAEARTSEGTAVINGDVVRLMADLVGKLVTSPHAPSDLWLQDDTTHTATTANQQLFAAAGAGVKNYLTTLVVCNTDATDTYMELKDGTTVIARIPLPGNGGATLRFDPPMKTSANAAMNIATAASISSGYAAGTGFTGR